MSGGVGASGGGSRVVKGGPSEGADSGSGKALYTGFGGGDTLGNTGDVCCAKAKLLKNAAAQISPMHFIENLTTTDA
jgi:hypothetical protein